MDLPAYAAGPSSMKSCRRPFYLEFRHPRRRRRKVLLSFLILLFLLVAIEIFGGVSLKNYHRYSKGMMIAPHTKLKRRAPAAGLSASTKQPVCALPWVCNWYSYDCIIHNQNATTTSSSPSHPPRSRSRSVIWYNYGDQAGFDDRRQVLYSLANLGASLCARLAVPPPYQLLDAERHGTVVSPALRWKDLLQIVPLAEEDGDASCPIHYPEAGEELLWELRQPAAEFVSKTYDNYQRWTSRTPQEFWRHFQELQQLRRLQRYVQKHTNTSSDDARISTMFLWEIKVSWHAVKQQRQLQSNPNHFSPQDDRKNKSEVVLLSIPSVFVDSHLEPTPPTGCLFIDPWSIPETMKEILHGIWNEILGEKTTVPDTGLDSGSSSSSLSSLVGFLHIRRGDSQQRCDTSLEKIRSFLTCSLKTLPPKPQANAAGRVALLLASDEINAEYRQGVSQIVDDIGTVESYSIEMLDLDSLVWGHIRHRHSTAATDKLQSNYYVYALESILKREYADFVLEQRQSRFCPDCQDLSQVAFENHPP